MEWSGVEWRVVVSGGLELMRAVDMEVEVEVE